MRLCNDRLGTFELQILGTRQSGQHAGQPYVSKRINGLSLSAAIQRILMLWPSCIESATPVRSLEALLSIYEAASQSIAQRLGMAELAHLPPSRCPACGRFVRFDASCCSTDATP